VSAAPTEGLAAPAQQEPLRVQAQATSPAARVEGTRAPAMATPAAGEVLPAPTGDRRAAAVFKVATVVLVLLALGLGGTWVLRRSAPAAREDPVAGRPAHPWELAALPPGQRDPGAAARLAGEGDEAVFSGDLALAQARFEEAWRADPSPELALKLGEVSWQQDRLEEATGWFQRFRRDAPASRAAEYVDRLPLRTREER
jgi:hypothetical protein